MTEEKWNLPSRFKLTPENIERSDTQQRELREQSNFVMPTVKEMFFRNAQVRAREIERLIAGGAEATEHLRRVLAENYAVLGEYGKAGLIEPDLQQALHYAEIEHAVWSPEQKRCDCLASPEISQNVVPVEEIFSRKESRYVKLTRCVMCKKMTVS